MKSFDSRRRTALNAIKTAGLMLMGGIIWSSVASRSAKATPLLRPPAARVEQDFLKSCIRCGLCVNACPYDTLRLATLDSDIPLGTPYFVPREVPCYMCEDVPCVPACPTDALDSSLIMNNGALDVNRARMGVAVVDTYTCIAYWGVQCDACHRACPLINQAITLDYRPNERTGKHAYVLPMVHNEVCSGCGKCERACVTDKPSITIIERDRVLGMVDSHYIKGWDMADEERLKGAKAKSPLSKSVDIQDYLNEEW